jgi:hypothetical protein
MRIENGAVGKLVRRVPTRVVDVSLSGCLVESDQDLTIGANGTLLVDLWGVPCRYPVRVSRVTERPGAGQNLRVAGEFTWNARPASDGLMAAVGGHRRAPARILPFAPRRSNA